MRTWTRSQSRCILTYMNRLAWRDATVVAADRETGDDRDGLAAAGLIDWSGAQADGRAHPGLAAVPEHRHLLTPDG